MPTILQSVAMVVISGTTATRTFPSACTPGSRIVARATQENHTGTFVISDPTNGVYGVDSAGANAVAGNGTAATIRSVENTASTALTVTVTLGASGNGTFIVDEISASVPDAASAGLGGVGSPTPTAHTGSITTTADNAAVFSIGGHYPSGAVVDSGYTASFAETGISIGYHFGEHDADVGAAGVKTITYGLGSIENWSLAIASYVDGGPAGPTVTDQPDNQNAYPGEVATFTVAATTSGGTLNYQWKFNGANVGTNSTTYTRTTVIGDDAGLITVDITDDNGTVTSATAILRVIEDVQGAAFYVEDDVLHSLIDGVAAIDGDPYSLGGGAADLDGDATITAAATGALTTAIPINGVALIVGNASGALSTGLRLNGSAAAVAIASGALIAQIRLSGAAITQALAAAGISTQLVLQAAAVAQGLASGTLDSGGAQLAGNAQGSGTATGALATGIAFAGSAQAQAAASANLAAAIRMGGNAAALALAAASLTAQIQFNGAALLQALATGELQGNASLAGAAQASGQASGALITAITILGAAVAQAQAAGGLSTALRLVGTASASGLASGSLESPVNLAGAAVSIITGTGALTASITFNAAALAVALAGGDLIAHIRLNGAAVAHAVASGSLATDYTPAFVHRYRVHHPRRDLRARRPRRDLTIREAA